MALCQVPGPCRCRRWPRLPIGAHAEQGDGRPDIPGHLPQSCHAPPERAALHLDALGARHLPPAGNRRDARQHVRHGQEGLQHDVQHPRQGDELGRWCRRRPGDGAARLQGSQEGRRQVGPHGQRAQPIRRIRHCRGAQRPLDPRIQRPRAHLPHPHPPDHCLAKRHPHDLSFGRYVPPPPPYPLPNPPTNPFPLQTSTAPAPASSTTPRTPKTTRPCTK